MSITVIVVRCKKCGSFMESDWNYDGTYICINKDCKARVKIIIKDIDD